MDAPPVVAEEQAVLDRVGSALRARQSEDAERDQALLARAREAHRSWTDARGDPAQREAFEEALAEAKAALDAHRRAHRARQVPLGTPYVARIVLQERARRQEVLLGKVGVVEPGLAIVDWRDAPISQLYYNYAEGDEYAETIGDREREGVLALRRRLDIREGALVEVEGGDVHLRLRPDGAWATPAA
jgi:DNA helicase-2/ATP-dependent DNA helicase PcrA